MFSQRLAIFDSSNQKPNKKKWNLSSIIHLSPHKKVPRMWSFKAFFLISISPINRGIHSKNVGEYEGTIVIFQNDGFNPFFMCPPWIDFSRY